MKSYTKEIFKDRLYTISMILGPVIGAIVFLWILIPSYWVYQSEVGQIGNCMKDYINKSYPIGCTYKNGHENHVDNCELDSWGVKNGTIDGCSVESGRFIFDTLNSNYCRFYKMYLGTKKNEKN